MRWFVHAQHRSDVKRQCLFNCITIYSLQITVVSFVNISCSKCAWTYSGLTNLCVGFPRQQWVPNWITCTFLSHKGEPSLIKTMWLMTPTLLPKEDKSLWQSLCCIGSCLHTISYSGFHTSSAEVNKHLGVHGVDAGGFVFSALMCILYFALSSHLK